MENKQSRRGIASFILTITSLITFIVLMVVITINQSAVNQGGEEADVMLTLYGLFAVIVLITDLTGVGLGIAGIVQKKRNRGLAIAGLSIGLLPLILLMIGMIAELLQR